MNSSASKDPPESPSSPPEAWEPLLRLARFAGRPLERFLRIEAASGILLLLAAAIALVWANSNWAGSYVRLRHTPLGIRIGTLAFEQTLKWFVNDGLMVIFFFFVGMEIRREIHHGELSEWRRAALPAAAACGGMLAPATLYLVIAGGPAMRSGWGVPMATDIAFAVGILALLGKRVPAALRVLLLALAVIDDLGAIVVIAFFSARREATSPAESLIATLHPWVAFVIMPLFVLANAGVVVTSGSLDTASWRVITGVAVGLIVGKPLGVLLACWLILRLGLGKLPAGISLRHLVVLGVVAGVGFTMALFISQLAFTDLRLLAAAKLGVLVASAGAAAIGLLLGRLLLAPVQTAGMSQTVDEAESLTEA